jgi:hypothetical protein
MTIEAMKQALEFIGDVYAGEWHGSILRREQVEQSLIQAIAEAEKQQRKWAGLTEKDLKPICNEWRIIYGAWVDDFAKEIEDKLKEKNEYY